MTYYRLSTTSSYANLHIDYNIPTITMREDNGGMIRHSLHAFL